MKALPKRAVDGDRGERTRAIDPEFVLSVLEDKFEKEIVRLATSELAPDEVIAKLLERLDDS